MPGFTVNNMGLELIPQDPAPTPRLTGTLRCAPYTVARCVLDMFAGDKLFYEDDKHLLVTDGVLLNSRELMAEEGQATLAATLLAMAAADREGFFARLRGCFSGAVYHKADDVWTIFTNHLGDRPIFYWQDAGRFAVGSHPGYLLPMLRQAGVELHLDEQSVLDILSFAFMERDNTYAREIKRLMPGQYLYIKGGEAQVRAYYTMRRDAVDISGKSYDELIDQLDELFRMAVRQEYDKDLEYGYGHLTSLSGGLDSRMNAWVACAEGYEDVTTVTLGRAGCLDFKIASQISRDLKRPNVFLQMDDATLMTEVDTIVAHTAGNAPYGMGFVSLRHNQVLGAVPSLSHTGQAGGTMLSTILHSADDLHKGGASGAWSRKMMGRLNGDYRATFADRELYQLNTRCCHCVLASSFIAHNYRDNAAPFIHPDFVDFCLALPIEYRMGYRIYRDWVLKKYPGAAKYRWEKGNTKITAPTFWQTLMNRLVHYPYIVLNVLGFGLNRGMVPHGYWYRKKPGVKQFFDDYFNSHIGHPLLSEQARADITYLFNKGYVNEKEQALTALASVWYYFPQGAQAE